MAGKPEPPAEASLIKRVREARRLTIPDVAARAGLSPSRWSQIENGYERKAGASVPVRAPAATLAHMASVLEISAEQLDAAGRPDALPVLAEIARAATPVGASTVPEGRRLGDAIDALTAAARAEGKPIVEVLLDHGVDVTDLIVPDFPPEDREIAELLELGEEMNLPPEKIRRLIQINLENRARRIEEARRRRRGEG